MVYNSNPVAWPRLGARGAGPSRANLFTVVIEHFRTDTADHADYLLPATTQLEHWDIHLSYGHADVLLNRPAIAPVGQARSNAIFRALAAAGMGFDELASPTMTRPCAARLSAKRIDSATLWLLRASCTRTCRAPFAEGASDPVGTCEFFSERLARQGLDGLPDHVPNYEPAGTPGLSLAMICPPARNFLNSTFVNVTSLRDIEGEPCSDPSQRRRRARHRRWRHGARVQCAGRASLQGQA